MNKSIFLTLFLLSCAHPEVQTDAMGRVVRKSEALGHPFVNAQSLVVVGERKVTFLQRQPDQKNSIVNVKDGKPEILEFPTTSPTALGFDERREQFYVADGSVIKIFKSKEIAKEIASIELPHDLQVLDIAYSIINRKAYATIEGDFCIWGINPKDRTAAVAVDATVLEKLGKGKPNQIWPSSDGTKLYVTTLGENSTSLVKINIRKKEAQLVQTFEGNVTSGIDVIKNHIVLAFQKPPFIKGYDMGREVWVDFAIPENLLHHPISMKLDRTYAMLLDQISEDGSVSLTQVALKFRD